MSSESETATVHIDGAARGNPGPAAYALTLERPGLPVVEESEPMGTATNNVAEYTALVRALERAVELGVKSLAVFSDSELLVKQMNGEYRVKNADLQELYRTAQALCRKFDNVTLAHVRRAQNPRADFLCNEALDGRPRSRAGSPRAETVSAASAPKPSPTAPARKRAAPERLEEEALALLNAVRTKWAAGAESPVAPDVWDRIWTMLQVHGVLR